MGKKNSNFKIYRYIKSLRKDLLILFLISILIIILIDFFLIDIPEIFNGGYKLGQLIYNICLAYISSFIFYFLIVHLKQQKDVENLSPFVAEKVYSLIGDTIGIISALSQKSDITIAGRYPSVSELEKMCIKINPHNDAPLYFGNLSKNANWIQYFEYIKKKSEKTLETIYTNIPFLETRLIKLLTKFDDIFHFLIIVDLPFTNEDLTCFQSEIATYFDLIEQLEKYADKNLKKYLESHTLTYLNDRNQIN